MYRGLYLLLLFICLYVNMSRKTQISGRNFPGFVLGNFLGRGKGGGLLFMAEMYRGNVCGSTVHGAV